MWAFNETIVPNDSYVRFNQGEINKKILLCGISYLANETIIYLNIKQERLELYF